MSSTFKNWTSDNYAFVGKAFDFAYADRLNKLSPVVGEVNAKSIDYELTGSGGYGEAPRYDGENLNEGSLKRGFKTVITPVEYTLSIPVGYKEAKVDKMGRPRRSAPSSATAWRSPCICTFCACSPTPGTPTESTTAATA